MKIETKLNFGDKVFFLFENKVISSKVQRIKIEVAGDSVEVVYVCNNEDDKQVGIKVVEKFAFKTKQQLIESL
jgi:hypothetical protein